MDVSVQQREQMDQCSQTELQNGTLGGIDVELSVIQGIVRFFQNVIQKKRMQREKYFHILDRILIHLQAVHLQINQ